MPEAFEHCVASGGRVRRIVPKPGTYINVCFQGGKSYSGEVHHTMGSARKDLKQRHHHKR